MNSLSPDWVTNFQSVGEAQLISAFHNLKTPSREFSLEPDLKVHEESDLHSEKYPSERTTTSAGRQTERNVERPWNAAASILVVFEYDSNVNDESGDCLMASKGMTVV
jgi:hypothetical protein